jgi:hypothetical protein
MLGIADSLRRLDSSHPFRPLAWHDRIARGTETASATTSVSLFVLRKSSEQFH